MQKTPSLWEPRTPPKPDALACPLEICRKQLIIAYLVATFARAKAMGARHGKEQARRDLWSREHGWADQRQPDYRAQGSGRAARLGGGGRLHRPRYQRGKGS